jgi:hypothetical protein
MDTTKTAIEALLDAERRLRELVGVAASGGHYESAVQITEWAREVGGLARATQEENAATEKMPPARNATPPRSVARAGRQPAPHAGGGAKRAIASARSAYPRFFRRQDTLVKVGWSKREKTEYEHKAPKHVALLLANSLARGGRNGKVLSTDELLPLVDPADRSEIPTYQAYVCLAWLRETGLVEARGRQGYLCKDVDALESALETAWNRTPAG